MPFTSVNKISEKTLHTFYEEGTFELPKKLNEKKYAKPFYLLKNWSLLKTFSIISYKLISHYIHLLDQEQFDEN